MTLQMDFIPECSLSIKCDQYSLSFSFVEFLVQLYALPPTFLPTKERTPFNLVH